MPAKNTMNEKICVTLIRFTRWARPRFRELMRYTSRWVRRHFTLCNPKQYRLHIESMHNKKSIMFSCNSTHYSGNAHMCHNKNPTSGSLVPVLFGEFSELSCLSDMCMDRSKNPLSVRCGHGITLRCTRPMMFIIPPIPFSLRCKDDRRAQHWLAVNQLNHRKKNLLEPWKHDQPQTWFFYANAAVTCFINAKNIFGLKLSQKLYSSFWKQNHSSWLYMIFFLSILQIKVNSAFV